MGGRKKNGRWRRGRIADRPQWARGARGRGMRIATGAERPRNDMVFTRGAVQVRAGRCGHRPLRRVTRGAMGGRPQGSPLRKRILRCVGEGLCPSHGRGRTPPLRKGYKRCGKTGRCGERTERCQWQRKRGERVAAVKILSVRRKAAQKFWAPQQDHRPLRKRNKRCNGRATARVAPTKCCEECVGGVSAPTEVF